MDNKLVVLSLDALQTNDLDILFNMPNFSKLKEKAAIVENLEEIYPTLTYPIHVTMVTGVTPDKHGIFHNQKSDISPKDHDWSLMGSNWYWHKENIKTQTIVDAVYNSNKTVSTVCWPVTAGDKRGINVPEIWPERGHNEQAEELFKSASSDVAFERYFDSYISKFDWKNNNDLVRFTPEIALDILKNDKPDLLLCHIIWLDHIRHTYGVEGDEVKDSLRQLDVLIGRFIQATKDAGTYDNTNFVILGDHGQIDIQRIFDLNTLFVENGLIELDENQNPKDYTAYSFSAGFSTQVILKNPDNKEDLEKVYKVLSEIKEKYPKCIERIYTKEEALEEENLSGNFSFVIEGTLGTYFGIKYKGKTLIEKGEEGYYVYNATHGHSTKKGNKPPLLAFGPDIKSKVVIEKAKMLDVCPTLARLSNVKMEGLMGKELDIFK
ncbi:ectonucleotide pyrophosphatase/phosphodiesterase [uncultured Tyzzerella sp.]|uniref:alkaline phosphatase family protein n=1 Tax=uncultured Tyzzerella sp. TaxID=2321398 RepID=UPI002942A54B|nr:ectonucleotide pyrophosphatase/phosphodiesterase [uncultured Tyzzerella sp.]